MNTGILMSADSGVDFMIHGIFSYNFFGHEVWITTTHVCLLIVMLVIIGFAIAANRAMKHASEVPGGFQNVVEMIVEKLDGMIHQCNGKECCEVCKLYRNDIYFYSDKQYFRTVRPEAAHGGLRCDASPGVCLRLR